MMKRSFEGVTILALAILGPVSSQAQTATSDYFTIYEIASQWYSEIVHIEPQYRSEIINPSGCPVGISYGLDPSVTGHKIRFTMLEDAFFNRARVKVTVDGCTSDGRPRIIAVNLSRR